MKPSHADGFTVGRYGVTFTRDDRGRVDGLTMSTARAWKVRFQRAGR